jgi:poly(A) polymerase
MRLLSRLGLSSRKKPTIAEASKYGVSAESVSGGALQVIERLKDKNYHAFIVGGAVRDLLLGFKPKDFDIATNATPEEIKPLFRRAFIIGRRFRLVHVLAGAETIEVSTFRAAKNVSDPESDEHGRILSDNVFGEQADDAARRDFTVNALYYDPVAGEIWDYLGSLKDIKSRQLRLIGDPETRYREDPVRMLRAVRLSAKLGLTIAPKTRVPIKKLAPLLSNVPPSRLFDEMLKLLMSGNAVATLTSLRSEGLHHGMLPLLDIILEQPMGQRFTELALGDTDQRVRDGKPVSPAFLFACMLWHEVLQAWETRKTKNERPIPALHAAMDEVLDRQGEQLAIPKRFVGIMKEIWILQPRFEHRSGQRPFRLLETERFRAAYDFLILRCKSGEVPLELADWWLAFQNGDTERRTDMLKTDEPRAAGASRKRRRPRKRRASSESGSDSQPADSDASASPSEEPAAPAANARRAAGE